MDLQEYVDQRLADLELRTIKLEQAIEQQSQGWRPEVSESVSDLETKVDARAAEKGFDVKKTPLGRLEYSQLIKAAGGTYTINDEVDLDTLFEIPSSSLAESISGLGHPVKIELFKALLSGPKESSELLSIPELNTTGQLYHHLQAMADVGLVERRSRNLWAAQNPGAFVLMLTAARTLSAWRGEAPATP
jgi:hypothetical protein